MATPFERHERLKEFFKFSWQEVTGLLIAAVISGFIFSFRNWGDTIPDLAIGLKNLLTMILISLISFLVHISFQKYFALSEGYRAEYKPWWVGMGISLIMSIVSLGFIPLVLIGGVNSSFMVRQRIGEFRYGYSYEDNSNIGLWGIYGTLILSIFFGTGLYYNPESFFYSKGLLFNLIYAFCSFIPTVQQDGLMMFFGSRSLYSFGLFLTMMASFLLLTQTKIGIIISIIFTVTYSFIRMFILEPNR
jgi:hypothetical protein